jgi:hypothetical protein
VGGDGDVLVVRGELVADLLGEQVDEGCSRHRAPSGCGWWGVRGRSGRRVGTMLARTDAIRAPRGLSRRPPARATGRA